MNKRDARAIAKEITNEQLLEMFNQAKRKINNWKIVSIVNSSMTKGVAWNFLAKDFDVNNEYNYISKVNMIREFGDFLPYKLKPKKKKKIRVKPKHQEPIF